MPLGQLPLPPLKEGHDARAADHIRDEGARAVRVPIGGARIGVTPYGAVVFR